MFHDIELLIIINTAVYVVTEISSFSPGRISKRVKRRHGIVDVLLRKAKDRDMKDVLAAGDTRLRCGR
jgi:hypothetical protein